MKNCDEMVNSLLKRRTDYIKKKQKRTKILSAVVPLCLCFIAAAGMAFWHSLPEKELTARGENSDSSKIFAGNYWTPDSSDTKCDPQSASSKVTLSKPQGPDIPYINGQDYIPNSAPSGTGTGDVRAMLIVDGVIYDQSDVGTQNAHNYTPDVCLGDVHDLEGTYKQYNLDGAGKAYTAKESPDILIVKLENGETVILKKQELK